MLLLKELGLKAGFQSGSTVKGAAKDKCRFGQTRSSHTIEGGQSQSENKQMEFAANILFVFESVAGITEN